MKTYKLLGLIAAVVFTFASCETEITDPAGIRDVFAVTSFSDVDPAIFIDGSLDDGFVQFTVNAEEGATFEDAYIVVSHNGTSQKKRLKDLSSFPQVVKITAVEAATALGMTVADIEVQDYFVFEVEVKIGGKIYRSNGALTSRVVCPFNPDLAIGSYTAVSGGWGVNGEVTITADPEDEYTVFVAGLAAIDGEDEDQGPLVMHINPKNFAVAVDKTVLASDVAGTPYHDLTYAGFGEYNSCTGTYQMKFAITVDAGSFGSFDFTIKRND